MPNRPKVGLGVIVVKDGKVLVGKRKNTHGEGTWCFPGGHLEFGESWETCARREVSEEAGINIKDLKFLTATNDIFEHEEKHYITIVMIAQYDYGEVKVMEPDKCECWEWSDWNQLPSPLFIPTLNLVKNIDKPF